MDFEIKQKTKITVGIYGQTYNLHKPTVDQAEALMSLEGKQDKSAISDSIKFLQLLGLPEEVTRTLEIDHMLDLVEFIVSKTAKKK